MKLLILGGTRFLGRAIVDQAADAGHEVTLFNRGRTAPDLYPELERLVGDRDVDLSPLHGRSFDAVIDTSAYFPRQVRAVVEALGREVGHYSFVSSMSVYADQGTPGSDETAAVAVVADPSVEELGENYGGFKALCEAALDELLPGRVHHVRAGLIVGPHDDTRRFTYWVRRIADGGDVLAPEPKSQPVQFIDVGDLASWIVHTIAHHITGVINATGTPGELTMESVLTSIGAETGGDATLHWVDEAFLVEHGVEAWQQLPLWLPPVSMPEFAGFMARDNSKALAFGLRLRPIAETIAATLDDLRTADNRYTPKEFGNVLAEPGLTVDHERELLRSWGSRGERRPDSAGA